MAQIVSLLRPTRHPRSAPDWSQQELAEFYRVEAALVQSGMRIESDRGVTDEGDPWFVFCRAEDGETFIHFARIDGQYLIAGPAYEGVAKGWDFSGLVRDLISRHPLVQPTTRRPSNLFMHPAALLIAVVGTAFFKTSEAKAMDESDHHKSDSKRHGAAIITVTAAPAVASPVVGSNTVVVMDANQTLTLVASAMAAQNHYRGSVSEIWSGASPAGEGVNGGLPHDVHSSHHETAIASFVGAKMAAAAGDEISFNAATQVAAATPSELNAWLSLTAVLHDLPTAPKPPSVEGAINAAVAMMESSPDPSLVRTAVDFAGATAVVTHDHAQAAPAPAQPSLAIELSPAALPDVAAVRIVRELDGTIGHSDVVKLDKLPDVLAQVIARGEQVHGDTDTIVNDPTDHYVTMLPSGPVVVDTPVKVDPTLVDKTDPGSTEQTPAGSHTSETSDSPSTPASTTTTSGTTTTTSGTTTTDHADSGAIAPPDPALMAPVYQTAAAHDAAIQAAITYFVNNTPDFQAVYVDNQVVFYDTRVIDHPELFTHNIDSVTYNFSDGTSLSLVGITQVIHDAQGLT